MKRTEKDGVLPHERRLREAAIGVFWLGIGIAGIVAVQAVSAEGQGASRFSPRWWPTILCGGLVALGVVQIIAASIAQHGPAEEERSRVRARDLAALSGVLLLAVAFLVMWEYIDFRVSASVLLIGIGFVLGARRWYQLTIVPVGIAVLTYLVFHDLFRVPL